MDSPEQPPKDDHPLKAFEDRAARADRTMLARMFDGDRASLRPTPIMTLPEWADTYRHLSTSSAAIGGLWKTSRVEVARGPMMAVTERGVQTITAKTCTQLLKTSLLENIIGRFAHLDPCPMLLTQPKEGAIRSFSKERLTPMAKATPVLQTILANDRARGGDDTFQYKAFPGGFLALESAGSPINLAMRAIRVTLLDEIDKYETTKEGDPVLLAEERASTFPHTKLHVRCCSPTWVETSRIHKSYLEGDQRLPYVTCPHAGCGHEFVLDFFKHVEWAKSPEGDHFPMTAAIYCEGCGSEWTEAQRLQIMTTEGAIQWRQTRKFTCCDEEQNPQETRAWEWDAVNHVGRAICRHCGVKAVSNKHASFTASKLYSPFITIPEMAQKWVDWKGDPESKQNFYNTWLGQAYEAQALKKADAHTLLARRETYPAPIPRGVLVLTAGVDVQPGSAVSDGRLEIEVVGWGLGEESWSIDTRKFIGDPSQVEVWKEIDQYLLTPFAYEGGQQMVVRGVCVDSGGHNTQDVYTFCRARLARNIWAIKGGAEKAGQWNPVWPLPRQLRYEKTRSTGYKPIIIGVNAAKEAIRQKLFVEQPGPGYCHFRVDQPEPWFDQLTSESLQLENKNGFLIRKWVLPKGRANEALDTRVYAYAALQGLRAVRRLNLAKIAEMLGVTPPAEEPSEPGEESNLGKPNGLKAVVAAVSPPPSLRLPLQPPAPRVRHSRWMQGGGEY